MKNVVIISEDEILSKSFKFNNSSIADISWYKFSDEPTIKKKIDILILDELQGSSLEWLSNYTIKLINTSEERGIFRKPFFYLDLLNSIRCKLEEENNVFLLNKSVFYSRKSSLIKTYNTQVSLHNRENEVIFYMLDSKDYFCSKDFFLKNIWKYHRDYESFKIIENFITRLRKKLKGILEIESIQNGYKLNIKSCE